MFDESQTMKINQLTFPYSAPAMMTSPAPLVATGKALSPKIVKTEAYLISLNTLKGIDSGWIYGSGSVENEVRRKKAALNWNDSMCTTEGPRREFMKRQIFDVIIGVKSLSISFLKLCYFLWTPTRSKPYAVWKINQEKIWRIRSRSIFLQS